MGVMDLKILNIIMSRGEIVRNEEQGMSAAN